jgi:hypothetical protein
MTHWLNGSAASGTGVGNAEPRTGQLHGACRRGRHDPIDGGARNVTDRFT